MEALRNTVLRCKEIADQIPASATLPRDAFIQVCTTAARSFVARPELKGDDEALQAIVAQEVARAVGAQVASPDRSTASRTGSNTPRTARPVPSQTPRTARQLDVSSQASVASTPRSASCASVDKVTALTAIKPYLDPAYRSGSISREDYSAIALRITNAFVQRFRSTGAPADAPVNDTERAWILTQVDQEVHIVTSTTRSGHAANGSRGAAAATVAQSSLDASGATPVGSFRVSREGSPFDRHLQKLREFVDKVDSGSADSAPVVAASPPVVPMVRIGASKDDVSSKRARIIGEIADIQAQMAALNRSLEAKVAELQRLE